jgi:hypothetical protein
MWARSHPELSTVEQVLVVCRSQEFAHGRWTEDVVAKPYNTSVSLAASPLALFELRALEILQTLDTLSDLRRGPLDRVGCGILDHPPNLSREPRLERDDEGD